MRLRLEPQDEYMHALETASNFNESMYFNFFDRAKKAGGFLRLGNRANEGYAEMTCCLYLPDGRVGFMFARPKIPDNSRFDAAGMRFTVKTPFKEHAIRYDGTVCLMARPLDLIDPKKAFTSNPHVPATIELTYTAVSPVSGGEPRQQRDGQWVSVQTEKTGQEFAKGHLEQHGHAVGRVVVDGTEWKVDGYGLRDRSWGPRYWQAPEYYRWLTANFGSNFGFMGSRIARRDSEGTRGGFVWDGTETRFCDDFEISTNWTGGDVYHDTIDATLRSGQDSWHVRGRVMNMIPLRNRREGLVTRISEGMTEWSCNGRTGYGLSEYLDQMIDGAPVGASEE